MTDATLQDSRTVPSLAELRAENAATMDDHANRRHGGEESATCKVCRHLHAINIVLDIVEAADAVMTAYVNGDTFEGEYAHPAMERLENLLALVRP